MCDEGRPFDNARPGRVVEKLTTTAQPWEPGWRGGMERGHASLGLLFDDGSWTTFITTTAAVEAFAVKLGLWVPRGPAPVFLGEDGHDRECAACAQCHHRCASRSEALSALDLRPSGIHRRVLDLESALFLGVELPGLARDALRGARSLWRAIVAPLGSLRGRAPGYTAGDALDRLIRHVEEFEVWEVRLDHTVTQVLRKRRVSRGPSRSHATRS